MSSITCTAHPEDLLSHGDVLYLDRDLVDVVVSLLKLSNFIPLEVNSIQTGNAGENFGERFRLEIIQVTADVGY